MSAAAKILNEKPSELELQVAQAFLDLESNSPELKADLRTLQFKSIREVGSIEIKNIDEAMREDDSHPSSTL
jgi:hypothetical protein